VRAPSDSSRKPRPRSMSPCRRRRSRRASAGLDSRLPQRRIHLGERASDSIACRWGRPCNRSREEPLCIGICGGEQAQVRGVDEPRNTSKYFTASSSAYLQRAAAEHRALIVADDHCERGLRPDGSRSRAQTQPRSSMRAASTLRFLGFDLNSRRQTDRSGNSWLPRPGQRAEPPRPPRMAAPGSRSR